MITTLGCEANHINFNEEAVRFLENKIITRGFAISFKLRNARYCLGQKSVVKKFNGRDFSTQRNREAPRP